MKITTIGVDLAKDAFQVHGIDERGEVRIKRSLKRREMMEFFTRIEPCLIGMESCGGAHYWARRLRDVDHTVKLMAPQFVKPYVKGNKHDAADAEAICEAVRRPTMRFVPIKTVDQQSILAVHRVRQGMIKPERLRPTKFEAARRIWISCSDRDFALVFEGADNAR